MRGEGRRGEGVVVEGGGESKLALNNYPLVWPARGCRVVSCPVEIVIYNFLKEFCVKVSN